MTTFVELCFKNSSNKLTFFSKLTKNGDTFVVFDCFEFKANCVIDNNDIQFVCVLSI